MWDYVIAAFAVICLFGLKIFLTYRSYENKKSLYEDPRRLAQDILAKKKKEMKTILDKVYDINQLKMLLLRNLAVIKSECKYIFFESNLILKGDEHLKTPLKDSSPISDRFRQIAILLSIMVFQHEKDGKKDVLENKINSLQGIFNEVNFRILMCNNFFTAQKDNETNKGRYG